MIVIESFPMAKNMILVDAAQNQYKVDFASKTTI
mgnify:CR=1 FL=1